MADSKAILALDVGDVRVGLALASRQARLAAPLTTLRRGDNFLTELTEVVNQENIGQLVVGLPRSLNGEDTAQTAAVRQFAEQLKTLDLPIDFQDEAVTSRQAETELQKRGQPYEKSDIDALAATYILSDWLMEHKD